jgi:hypothetical protein
MENKAHNPNYKLVETNVFLNDVFVDLVYGETNEGFNEGLEVYFKKERNEHHYKSFRYLEGSVPKKYLSYYEFLKQYVIDNEVKEGCKIVVRLPMV